MVFDLFNPFGGWPSFKDKVEAAKADEHDRLKRNDAHDFSFTGSPGYVAQRIEEICRAEKKVAVKVRVLESNYKPRANEEKG